MSSTEPEWKAISEVVILAVLVLFIMISFTLLFLRRRNEPLGQTIEVDPREPHSITITFIPAQIDTGKALIVDESILPRPPDATNAAPATGTGIQSAPIA